MKSDLIPSQSPEEQAQEIKSTLESYDYGGVIKTCLAQMFPKTPTTGRPLRSNEFSEANLNSSILDNLEQALETNQIVVFAAAPRMGKTSIGLTWRDASTHRNFVDSMATDIDLLDIGDVSDFDQIFIDEFNTTNENIAIARALLEVGKKVIISTDLINLDSTNKFLTRPDISSTQIIIPMSDYVEIRTFVAKTLNIETEDELAESISKLSGGSSFVASLLASKLIFTAASSKPETSSKELVSEWSRGVRESLSSFTAEWERMKSQTPESLHKYIPNPAAKYL